MQFDQSFLLLTSFLIEMILLLVWEVTDFFKFVIVVDSILFSSRVIIVVEMIGVSESWLVLVVVKYVWFVSLRVLLIENSIVSFNDLVRIVYRDQGGFLFICEGFVTLNFSESFFGIARCRKVGLGFLCVFVFFSFLFVFCFCFFNILL